MKLSKSLYSNIAINVNYQIFSCLSHMMNESVNYLLLFNYLIWRNLAFFTVYKSVIMSISFFFFFSFSLFLSLNTSSSQLYRFCVWRENVSILMFLESEDLLQICLFSANFVCLCRILDWNQSFYKTVKPNQSSMLCTAIHDKVKTVKPNQSSILCMTIHDKVKTMKLDQSSILCLMFYLLNCSVVQTLCTTF